MPLAGFGIVAALILLWGLKFSLPGYYKRCRAKPEELVALDTAYRRNVWERVRDNVKALLVKVKTGDLFVNHTASINKVEKFSQRYIQKYYEEIR
ncbi:hypothetical protein MNBD_DELTA03-1412 [hydrothermal vent metagenome]|uniref:Uncharacterized protein n=1 Tax=hydrothermal vent metagenome TaxID=652676 RepID=A0A3B0VLP6_9ZZZZ